MRPEYALAVGLLSVRVKSKKDADVKGTIEAPMDQRLYVEEMRPW